MKEFLQGAWLKHPLHPALVHIPVSVWPAALVFDLLAYTGNGGNTAVRVAFYAILMGLVVALAAVPTGIADWWDIKQDRPAWTLGVFHMVLNLTASAVWALNLGLRAGAALNLSRPPLIPLLLSIIGTLLVLISGYLGGRMVFNYGISVGRNSKQKWREIAQAGHANLPPAK